MKFIIEGSEFKSMMERVMAAIDVRSAYASYSCVMLEARENDIRAIGFSNGSKVIVDRIASVSECGTAFIHVDDLKKVYSLPGDLLVECRDKKCKVRNAKKCCEVPTYSFDDVYDPFASSNKNEWLFTSKADDLLHMFAVTDAARAGDDTRVALTGFDIDGKHNKIIACDGNRLHAAEIVCESADMLALLKLNRIVGGMTYTHLKKIAKGKGESPVSVYNMDKCILFKGDDFQYYAGVVDAEYINVYEVMPKARNYTFHISGKDLLAAAKEYRTFSKKRDPAPMHLIRNGERMTSVLMADCYRTSDEIKCKDVDIETDEEFALTFDPAYIFDAMSCCGDDITVYGEYSSNPYGYNVKPTVFACKNFEALILPMRPKTGALRAAAEFAAS